MSIIRPFRLKDRSAPAPQVARGASERGISDDQALQELVEILKQPYQSNCDHCSGRGQHPENGRSCEHCQGTGRVLMHLL